MNKQIKKLAGQACDVLCDGDWNIPDEFIEKFAKSIVQECIDLAYKEGDNVAYLSLHFGESHD